MNNLTKTLAVAALAAVAAPSVSFAAVPASAVQNVPGTMNYQGYLADPSTGAAYVDGIYTLVLRIWNSDVGTSASACLWGGKYSVYVKDGYFNLMLGDSGATELTSADGVTPVYKNADLWKALWGTSETDTARYLGVTPLQDANHATISAPSEIQPRQRLLTSPFAFRAQHAQYADQAQAGFSVPGNLTVSGNATVSGTISGKLAADAGSSVGPVKTTSNTVNLGNGHTSATSDNRASLPTYVYDVGQYLYFYSYYNMNFKPTAGNAIFTIPSGYNMKVTGAGSFVSDTPVNTIGGTGATTVGGTGTTTVKGSATTVKSTTGLLTLTADNNNIQICPSSALYGQGEVRWAPSGKTLANSPATISPMQVRIVDVSIKKGSTYGTAVIASDTSGYAYVTCGLGGTGTLAPNEVRAYLSSANWIVRVCLPTAAPSDCIYKVTCLGISKCFLQDNR